MMQHARPIALSSRSQVSRPVFDADLLDQAAGDLGLPVSRCVVAIEQRDDSDTGAAAAWLDDQRRVSVTATALRRLSDAVGLVYQPPVPVSHLLAGRSLIRHLPALPVPIHPRGAKDTPAAIRTVADLLDQRRLRISGDDLAVLDQMASARSPLDMDAIAARLTPGPIAAAKAAVWAIAAAVSLPRQIR